jgi:hypothetical protein
MQDRSSAGSSTTAAANQADGAGFSTLGRQLERDDAGDGAGEDAADLADMAAADENRAKSGEWPIKREVAQRELGVGVATLGETASPRRIEIALTGQDKGSADGVSSKSAGAILASSSRKASSAAKKKNPRLAKVKGAPKGKKKQASPMIASAYRAGV